jgi:uncharacterized protein DUF6843
MTPSSKLWLATLANVTAAALLLVSIYAILGALAAFASAVSSWPIPVFLGSGLVASVVALRLRKNATSAAQRAAALTLNLSALGFDLLVVVGLALMVVTTTKKRFLIPDGYKGDVVILHSVRDAEPLNKNWRGITYRIPTDGFLRTSDPVMKGLTTETYYYERKDGSLQRIPTFQSGAIHQAPENPANDHNVQVLHRGSGSFTDFTGCSVELEEFFVGTEAYLMSGYRQADLSRYLHDHPGTCLK